MSAPPNKALQQARHLFSAVASRGSFGATPFGRGLTSAAGAAQLSAWSLGGRAITAKGVARAVRIALVAVIAQVLASVSVFVMYASSPDYLITLTMSLVFALFHVLVASILMRISPRWCALLVLPFSAGVAVALILNAGRFVYVYSKALSNLVS